jgi:hypothetical protein
MSYHNRFAIFIALYLAALPVHVSAQVDPSVRKAIQARYDTLNKAFMKKNLQGIRLAFADDCEVKLEGEPTRLKSPQYVALIGKSFAAITVRKVTTRIDTLVPVKGKPGVYEVHATSESAYAFQPPSTGNKKVLPQKLKGNQVVVDTWLKTIDGWRISARKVKQND